jgi:hypothetical protein
LKHDGVAALQAGAWLPMSLILRRSLIFIVLLAAGLVLYAVWYGIRADRFEDTAVPYLQRAVPALTSWQYARLEPLLSPAARLDFENEKVRAAYRGFERLGKLQSMGKPRYMADRVDTSSELGEIQVIDYQVPLQFDSGPAMLEIKLVAAGKTYYIQHFGFHSEIFAAGE